MEDTSISRNNDLKKSLRPYSPFSKDELHHRSKRHTNRVQQLRFLLPLLSTVLISIIMVWPFLNKNIEQENHLIAQLPKTVIKKNKVLMPKIVSVNEKGQPFTLISKSAEQDHPTLTSFEEPVGTFKTEQGSELELRARSALYDKNKSIIDYRGEVTLKTSEGYNLTTPQALYDTRNQITTSIHPVSGTVAGGRIKSSQGFEATLKDIHFKGYTQIILPKEAASNNKDIANE